jgi:hypothetical protein
LLFGHSPSSSFDLTILRIRGLFTVSSDQNSTTEDQVGVMGAIIVSDNAFAAGAASVPGPIADAADHWMLWMPFIHRYNVVTAVGVMEGFAHQHPVDNKAQRVIEAGETLAFIVESGSESEGFITSWKGRILTRLRGTR